MADKLAFRAIESLLALMLHARRQVDGATAEINDLGLYCRTQSKTKHEKKETGSLHKVAELGGVGPQGYHTASSPPPQAMICLPPGADTCQLS